MIYLGVPTYNGLIHHSTVGGLFNVAFLMGRQNVHVCVDVVPHDCFIGHARSLMAKRFLSIPDATDMVMIDADVGFSDEDFDRLMKVDADIVCGIYPYKQDDEKYPAAALQPIERRGKMVKLVYGPTGFMRIRRRVFEKLKNTVESYNDATHGVMHDFFPCGRDGFLFRGEDTWFCRLATQAGLEIWGLEGMKLKHTGTRTWEGEWTFDKPSEVKIIKTQKAA